MENFLPKKVEKRPKSTSGNRTQVYDRIGHYISDYTVLQLNRQKRRARILRSTRNEIEVSHQEDKANHNEPVSLDDLVGRSAEIAPFLDLFNLKSKLNFTRRKKPSPNKEKNRRGAGLEPVEGQSQNQ